MAAIKFQKGSEEWLMFTEFWKLCQDYWEIENSDTYWQALIDECNRFADKFKACTLSKRLVLALLDDKDKEFQSRKN